MGKKGDKQEQTQDVWESRRGLSLGALKRGFMDHLRYTQGRIPQIATLNDLYMALAYTVKDRLLHRWIRSGETYLKGGLRAVSYLSAEFLLGPQLANNLINLGIYEEVREAFEAAGGDWNALLEHEPEPGLGNGGLGRLAACFLDSLATLQIPSIGYGIRYEFGIFSQSIQDGKQIETTDKWLSFGESLGKPQTGDCLRREARWTYRARSGRGWAPSGSMGPESSGERSGVRHSCAGLQGEHL